MRDIGEVLRDTRNSTDLLVQLARRDVTIRYKQAVMGFGWAIFMPILVVLAGTVVRLATAFASGAHIAPADIAAIMVKAVPWSFFVGAIGFATTSLTGNMNLVTKVSFPREVLPMSSVLAQCVDLAIASAMVILILPFIGVTLSWALLWVPILIAVLVLFTAAASLFLSCANLFYRDVKYIVQTILTFGIFFTPVFFEPSMLGRYGRLLMLNPIAPILEGLRLSIVQHHNLLQPLTMVARNGVVLSVWDPAYLAYCAVWTVGGLLAAMVLFHRSEFIFAEYV